MQGMSRHGMQSSGAAVAGFMLLGTQMSCPSKLCASYEGLGAGKSSLDTKSNMAGPEGTHSGFSERTVHDKHADCGE